MRRGQPHAGSHVAQKDLMSARVGGPSATSQARGLTKVHCMLAKPHNTSTTSMLHSMLCTLTHMRTLVWYSVSAILMRQYGSCLPINCVSRRSRAPITVNATRAFQVQKDVHKMS